MPPEIWVSAPVLTALDLQGPERLSSSAESSNLMSIKKKNTALLHNSQSYFRMLLLAFAGSFSPSHRLLLPWQARHSMSCQVTVSCKEMHVSHPSGMQLPGDQDAPTGSLPPRVPPGHSLCGLQSHEVMPAPYQVPQFELKHQSPGPPTPYGERQNPTLTTHGGRDSTAVFTKCNEPGEEVPQCRKHTIAWPLGLGDRQPGVRLFQVPPTLPMKHRSDGREEAQLKKTVTPKGLERQKDTPYAVCQTTSLSQKYALC